MSITETAINYSKEMETILEESYGAMGRGLAEKAKVVGHILPEPVLESILTVARIRNKIVHDNNFDIQDNSLLEKAAKHALDYLKKTSTSEALQNTIKEKNRALMAKFVADMLGRYYSKEKHEWRNYNYKVKVNDGKYYLTGTYDPIFFGIGLVGLSIVAMWSFLIEDFLSSLPVSVIIVIIFGALGIKERNVKTEFRNKLEYPSNWPDNWVVEFEKYKAIQAKKAQLGRSIGG